MKHNKQNPNEVPTTLKIQNPEDAKDYLSSHVQFAQLSHKQLNLLVEIAADLTSDSHRSDTALARAAGVHRHSVRHWRSNPQFASALGVLVLGITRGRADVYLRWTEQAAKDGKVNALKLLWDLSGLYITRTRSENVNVNVTQPQPVRLDNVEQALEHVLISLGSKGVSLDRIISKWNELKTQGAF